MGSRARCTLSTQLTYSGCPGFKDSAALAAILASLSREPMAQGGQRRQSIASHRSRYIADWQRENRAAVSGSPKEGICMASTHDENAKTTAEPSTEPPKTVPASTHPAAGPVAGPSHRLRKWLFIHAIIAALVVAGYFLAPTVKRC